MIISKTPYRISFFGGGTDHPVWYKEYGGAVLGTTIDKHCYINCRYLPPFFEHKYRIVYSKIEIVKKVSEIVHPAVKAILEHMRINEGLEIHHDGDLPARTGIGSSSSFVVGLLHTLYALKGKIPTKKQLIFEAIHIERDILKEEGGIQDQIHAAIGGFNKIIINQDGDFQVIPMTIHNEKLQLLQNHLMLYFTGFSRYSFNILKSQVENIPKKKRELSIMQQMVDEAISILNSNDSIIEFGKLLHEAWILKRNLSEDITNPKIDEIYEASREAGAIGGKLLGAGGGGFILLFVKPEDQFRVKERLKILLQVPFRFEFRGSQIVVYEPDFPPDYFK